MIYTLKKLKRGRIPVFKSEDTELLAFLWKWKLATPALIKQMLFPNRSPKAIWTKFNKLERIGFIDCKYDPEKTYLAWTLTSKGHQTLFEMRDHLRESCAHDGFASENPKHDFLVTAFHIGDLAFVPAKNVELISEQELRRFHRAYLEKWVPPAGLHRPDGYTLVTRDKKRTLIAVEVELSQKNEEAYTNVFRFYYDRSDINTVLWLVESQRLMEKLLSILADSRMPEPEKHNFILRRDFIADQWGARILSGTQAGNSIREYIWGLAVEKPQALQGNLIGRSGFMTLLGNAKYAKN